MLYYQRNLYVLCLTNFLAAASWNQVLPFLPPFLRELGVTDHLEEWSGLVFAANFLAAIVMQPFWGKLADTVGRKPMTVRAGFCLVGIYFAMSFATAPWQVAVLRFLNGALTGFIPGATTLVATNSPKHLAARYVAAMQTASAAGSMIGPILGGMLSQVFGYRGSMRVSGTVVLISVLLVVFLVEERQKVQGQQRTTLWQDFRYALNMPVLLTVMLAMTLSFGASSAAQPLLTLYVEELAPHAPPWVGGLAFALPGIAFVLSAGAWTRLGEKVGHHRVTALSILGTGIAFLILFAIHNVWLFLLVFFLAGLCMSGPRPAGSALIAERVPDEFQGRAFAMQQSALTFGGFLFPILGGLVSGHFGHRYVFLFMAGVLLAGAQLVARQSRRWSTAPASQAPPSPTVEPALRARG